MVVSALDLGAEPECLGRASKRKAVVYDAILVEDNETAAWDNADSRRKRIFATRQLLEVRIRLCLTSLYRFRLTVKFDQKERNT